MANIRELVAKAIAAGFTGKKYRNTSTGVKPSPRRQHIGNTDFDKLGKRMQKIVRRMAVQGDKTVLDLIKGWQLVSNDADQRRRCNIRTKDAHAINALKVYLGTRGFEQMLETVRAHSL